MLKKTENAGFLKQLVFMRLVKKYVCNISET